jgi:signal transduction histidine kinase
MKRLMFIKQNADRLIQNSVYSAFMMTNLINDLLDLAKLNNSAFTLNFEKCNLFEVIETAFDIIVFQAKDRDIKFNLVVNSHQAYIFKNVMIDRRRVLQIILNFLSNSLKFTSNGGFIKVHLKLLEEQVNHKIKFDLEPDFT